MNQLDKTKFAGSLLAVSEMYDKAISPEYVEIYWLALKEYELDDIRESWGKHLKNTENGMFMPKPCDVIKIITGGQKSAALEAWQKVVAQIRKHGYVGSQGVDDFATNVAVNVAVEKIGGWRFLCGLTSEQLEKKRVEFEVMYNRELPLSYASILSGKAHGSHSFQKVIP